MTFYRFYINGVLLDQVDEPTSWDGQTFTVNRSKEYFGFENENASTLKFWNQGADIIKEAYKNEGIEARLSFKVQRSCDKGKTWTTDIDGILNCASYTYQNGEVTISYEESDFNRTFKNRIDTAVSLYSELSLDGLPISDLQPTEVTLRSKAIIQESELIANATFLSYETGRYLRGDDIMLYMPLAFANDDLKKNDLKSANEVAPVYEQCSDDTGGFNCPKQPVFTNENNFPVTVRLTGRIKGHIELATYFNITQGLKLGNTGLILAYGTYGSEFTSNLGASLGFENDCRYPGDSDITHDVDFDIYINQDIILNFNQSIWLYEIIETIGGPSGQCGDDSDWLARVSIDQISFLNFKSETVTTETKSKVFLVHEALAKVCEVITGEKDCLKSEYFGSGNSQPRQYNLTGCQRYVSLTNGLNIRNMLQKDGTPFPINVSFSQLYKLLDSVYCLGMRCEYDESEGRWFVRVEKREYFFDKNDDLEFDAVSDIMVKASMDNYFNGVSIGYKKWQLNNGQINGLDEFNTKRQYAILNKNSNKKLDIQCEAIAGGYPIEFTRRQQYNVDTTKDFETDNDLFLICLNRIPITFNGIPYAIGTINEANELFPSVTNLISPSTAYNLRISPARNMYRWLRYIKCSLYKKTDKVIKFTSGEGNFLMVTEHEAGYCEPSCEMDEHATWKDDVNCFEEAGDELIAPENIEFEIPFDFSIFTQLLGNLNKSIRVNCSNEVIYKGFLNQNNFKPNQSEGGTAKLILTTTPSNGAAFDSGFDEGFDSIP